MKRKKMNDAAASILAFINRNEREQEIPKDFVYIGEWIKRFNCSTRTWSRILQGLTRAGFVEFKKLRRVKDKKLRLLNYYKIDKAFLKKLGIK